MWMTIAIGSAIAFGLGQVAVKSASIKKSLDQYLLLGLYCAGALFFLVSLGGHVTFNQSHPFILWAIFIALGSYLGNWAVIKAMSVGSDTLTSPLLKLNVLLIIGMSAFIYDEKFNFIKILIICFMFIGLLFSKYHSSKTFKIKEKKWIAFIAIGIVCLFLRDGGLKITQELGFNNTELLLFAYTISILFTIITMLIIHNHKKERPKEFVMSKHRSLSIYYGILAGVFSALGLHYYTLALATGPASLSILLFSGRSFVMVLFSFLLFKEKIYTTQILGFVLFAIGLILIGYIL